jgi:hypothetical protein
VVMVVMPVRVIMVVVIVFVHVVGTHLAAVV